ncbi:hypothetical protein ES707_13045 [subsurface metagenome]
MFSWVGMAFEAIFVYEDFSVSLLLVPALLILSAVIIISRACSRVVVSKSRFNTAVNLSFVSSGILSRIKFFGEESALIRL